MDGNDIGAFTTSRQAAVWEGLLATTKQGRFNEFHRKRLAKAQRWDDWLTLWEPQEVALKTMVYQHNRMGIATDVYTFIDEGLVDPLEHWLARKDVSCKVFYYPNRKDLIEDLRYNRSVQRVLCGDQDLAADIGIRAMCVGKGKGWS